MGDKSYTSDYHGAVDPLKSMKILAIQFKYMGDAVILTPALKALKTQIPNIELHVLVAAEIAPLLENLSWITKVWAMPRTRGKTKISQSLPFIKILRKEKFEKCVDFGGNDRGALLSLLCGARTRLGPIERKQPKLIQKICYTQTVLYENCEVPLLELHFKLLSAWGISKPRFLGLEIACNPNFADVATEILPQGAIICHIATSQVKKDWPITHWKTLYSLALQAGLLLVFSSGTNERERKLLDDFKALAPEAITLPPITDLNLFLNVLKIARLVIAGDTGPLHFAAGLGVPVLGIFAVGNSLSQAAPIYKSNQKILASHCVCYSKFSHLNYCKQANSCMGSIKPEAVFLKLQNNLNASSLNV